MYSFKKNHISLIYQVCGSMWYYIHICYPCYLQLFFNNTSRMNSNNQYIYIIINAYSQNYLLCVSGCKIVYSSSCLSLESGFDFSSSCQAGKPVHVYICVVINENMLNVFLIEFRYVLSFLKCHTYIIFHVYSLKASQYKYLFRKYLDIDKILVPPGTATI